MKEKVQVESGDGLPPDPELVTLWYSEFDGDFEGYWKEDYDALKRQLKASLQRERELADEVSRLREINAELVNTHNTLVIENSHLRHAAVTGE